MDADEHDIWIQVIPLDVPTRPTMRGLYDVNVNLLVEVMRTAFILIAATPSNNLCDLVCRNISGHQEVLDVNLATFQLMTDPAI